MHILVATHTAVEDRRAFISTSQLGSGEEHFLSTTLVADFLCNSLYTSVLGGQCLHGRPLCSQSRGEGIRLGFGEDGLRESIWNFISYNAMRILAMYLPLFFAPQTSHTSMASGDPVLSCSRLPQSVQKMSDPMADMVANKEMRMRVWLKKKLERGDQKYCEGKEKKVVCGCRS